MVPFCAVSVMHALAVIGEDFKGYPLIRISWTGEVVTAIGGNGYSADRSKPERACREGSELPPQQIQHCAHMGVRGLGGKRGAALRQPPPFIRAGEVAGVARATLDRVH